jgi:hypothetical protein
MYEVYLSFTVCLCILVVIYGRRTGLSGIVYQKRHKIQKTIDDKGKT